MILHLTIRFLDNIYHGRGDNGTPEWPPSPFRIFQAMIAGSQGSWSKEQYQAFEWLEQLEPPTILAPPSRAGSSVLTFVPNNDQQPKRTQKLIAPQVLPNDSPTVEYIWSFVNLDSQDAKNAKLVAETARHIHSVGWGVDLAVGHGNVTDQQPILSQGFEIHMPFRMASVGGNFLRMPRIGSLASLHQAHERFLNRIRRVNGKDEIHDNPGTVRFDTCIYASSPTRPFCAFEFLSADEEEKPVSFDLRRIKSLVGMLRGLFNSPKVRTSMNALNPNCVDSILLGHADDPASPRLSIMPLLSIGHRHADTRVRRVILAEPYNSQGTICHLLGEILNGKALQPDDPAIAPTVKLQLLRRDDAYVQRWYASSSYSWTSVSPVLLPGFDHRTDKRDGRSRKQMGTAALSRAEKLVLKSLQHAGISIPCKVAISHLSWWPRVPHASAFVPREKLGPAPRYHVKLTFDQRFTGPLSLGRQRHMGLGVFAAIES